VAEGAGFSVASTSACASGLIVPTPAVNAASPCHPSTIAPQSIEMMSPSRRTYGPGIPCTITSLGEAQITPGKVPRYPRKFERAPRRSMTSRPMRSRAAVVTPGRMAARMHSCISATTLPARRILASSSGERLKGLATPRPVPVGTCGGRSEATPGAP
jgi:hypothetical protein